ncbi:hypothetical protein D9M72_544830 [compost metagenome]
MARIEEGAAEKSRSVRRKAQRQANWRGATDTLRRSLPAPVPAAAETWVADVQPFDDIEEAE